MISSSQVKSVGSGVAYYTGDKEELTQSSWGGKGAALAGLPVGEAVTEHAFKAALEGKIAGQQIKGGFSKTEGPDFHRPGMDFTYSPGKSVAVVGLVGGDERVLAAHSAAVGAAMNYLEANAAQARTGHAGAETQDTGNLLYAKFEHTTTRNHDPQIHTHVVVMNATKTEGGDWMSARNRPLLALKSEADAVYGQELDKHLKTLGYKTVPGKSGPEIAGFEPEQLKAFSSRSKDMSEHLAQRDLTLETASGPERQAANFATRAGKETLTHEELMAKWNETAKAVGLDVTRLSSKRPELAKIQVPVADPLQIRKAVDTVAQGMRDAGATFDALASKSGATLNRNERAALHTAHAAQAPRSGAQMLREVRNTDKELSHAPRAQVTQALDNAVEKGGLHLQDGLYSAEKKDVHAQRVVTLQELDKRPTPERVAQLDKAVARVVDKMQATQDAAKVEIKATSLELGEARKSGNKPEIEALQVKLEGAESRLSSAATQLHKDVRAELVGPANAREINEALGRALEAGSLHRHAAEQGKYGRLGVEPAKVREPQAEQPTLDRTDAHPTREDSGVSAGRNTPHEPAQGSEQPTKAQEPATTQEPAKAPESAAHAQGPAQEHPSQQSAKAEHTGASQDHASQQSTASEKAEHPGASQDQTKSEPNRLDQAVSRVIDKMNDARVDVKLITEALADARKDALKGALDASKAPKAPTLEGAEQLAATQKASKEAREARVENLEKALFNTDNHVSFTVAQMRKEVRGEGVGFASSQEINRALERAIEAGSLHKDVGKLSVESETDKDVRLGEQKEAKSTYKDSLYTVESTDKKAMATAAWKEKSEKSAQDFKDKRNERIALRTPEQKAAMDALSPLSKITKGIVGVVHAPGAVANTIMKGNPIVALGKGGKALTKYAAINLFDAGKAASFALTKAVFQQGRGIFGQGQRDKAQDALRISTAVLQKTGLTHAPVLDDKGALKLNRKGKAVNAGGGVKLYAIGDKFGEMSRPRLTASNALILATAGVLNAIYVDRLTGGAVLRNELLLHVKTTHISLPEAMVSRTIMAVSKTIVHATGKFNNWALDLKQDSDLNKATDKYNASLENRKHAYSNHIKTTLAHANGTASAADVEKSAARLAKTGADAEKKHEKLFQAATSKFEDKRMNEKFYQRVVDHRNGLRDAVRDFKEKGSITIDQTLTLIGGNKRDLQKLERDAGKDVLWTSASSSWSKDKDKDRAYDAGDATKANDKKADRKADQGMGW